MRAKEGRFHALLTISKSRRHPDAG